MHEESQEINPSDITVNVTGANGNNLDLSSILNEITDSKPTQITIAGDNLHVIRAAENLPLGEVIWPNSENIAWQSVILKHYVTKYKDEVRALNISDLAEDKKYIAALLQGELLTCEPEMADFTKYYDNHLEMFGEVTTEDKLGNIVRLYYPEKRLGNCKKWNIPSHVMGLYEWMSAPHIHYMKRIWPGWQGMEFEDEDINWVFDFKGKGNKKKMAEQLVEKLAEMTDIGPAWKGIIPYIKNDSNFENIPDIANKIIDHALFLWVSEENLRKPKTPTEAAAIAERLGMIGQYIQNERSLDLLPEVMNNIAIYMESIPRWNSNINIVFPAILETMSIMLPEIVFCLTEKDNEKYHDFKRQFQSFVIDQLSLNQRDTIKNNLERLQTGAFRDDDAYTGRKKNAIINIYIELNKAWFKALPISNKDWQSILTTIATSTLAIAPFTPASLAEAVINLSAIAKELYKLLPDNTAISTHANLHKLWQYIKKNNIYDQTALPALNNVLEHETQYPSWLHGYLAIVLIELLAKNRELETQIVWGIATNDDSTTPPTPTWTRSLMYYAARLLQPEFHDAAIVAIAALEQVDFRKDEHQEYIENLRNGNPDYRNILSCALPILQTEQGAEIGYLGKIYDYITNTNREPKACQDFQEIFRKVLWDNLAGRSWDEVKIRIEQYYGWKNLGAIIKLPLKDAWLAWAKNIKDESHKGMFSLLLQSSTDAAQIFKLLDHARRDGVEIIHKRFIYQVYLTDQKNTWFASWGYQDLAWDEINPEAIILGHLHGKTNIPQHFYEIDSYLQTRPEYNELEMSYERCQTARQALIELLQEGKSKVQIKTLWAKGYLKKGFMPGEKTRLYDSDGVFKPQKQDKDGNWAPQYTSRSSVGVLGDFHIKLNPLLMGGELVSQALEQALWQIEPHWTLGTIEYESKEKEPIWLTQTIAGKTFASYKKADDLDLDSYCRALLLTVLLRAEDIKPDNVVLKDDGKLKIIDNEVIGCEPIRRKKSGDTQIVKTEDIIVMKNFLLCMPQIEEIVPPQFKTWISGIDIEYIIEEWMLLMHKYDYMVKNLVPENIIEDNAEIYRKSIKGSIFGNNNSEVKGFILRPTLPVSLISRVRLGLNKARQKILGDDAATMHDVVEILEPSISQVYYQVRIDHPEDLNEAFEKIENGQYNRINNPTAAPASRHASVATQMQVASALGQIANEVEEQALAINAIKVYGNIKNWEELKSKFGPGFKEVTEEQIRSGWFTRSTYIKDLATCFKDSITNLEVIDYMTNLSGYSQKEEPQQQHQLKIWQQLIAGAKLTDYIKSLTLSGFKVLSKDLLKQLYQLRELVILTIDDCKFALDDCKFVSKISFVDILNSIQWNKKLKLLKLSKPSLTSFVTTALPVRAANLLQVKTVVLEGINIENTVINMQWQNLKTVRIGNFSGQYCLNYPSLGNIIERSDTKIKYEKDNIRNIFTKRVGQVFETASPLPVNTLIQLVMDGEQSEAEAIIKADTSILRHRGIATDPAGRTFENITAFQYALWALDWYMWEMMLPHMDASEGREQYDALMSHGTNHGKQFDFGPLIAALQTYIDKNAGWGPTQRLMHWGNVVGDAQRKLPMHAVQEHCRTDRSFDPCPDFSKGARGREFKVVISYSQGFWDEKAQVFKRSHWFPTSGTPGPWGRGEASYVRGWVSRTAHRRRGVQGGCGVATRCLGHGHDWNDSELYRYGHAYLPIIQGDRVAIGDLFNVRKQQLRALGKSLSQAPGMSR